MKGSTLALLTTTMVLSPLVAAEEKDSSGDRPSSQTPTAERPPNMANPEKPDWLPQRHGK